MSIGSLAITSLGVFSLLAFLTAAFELWRRGREEGLDEEALLDLAFLGAISGFVIGRIGYVLEHWPVFGWQFGRWLDFSHFGGLSFFSACLGALLVAWRLSLKQKWNLWSLADMAVFGLVLAQILLRLGQFFDGSFLGKKTDLAIGLLFPGHDQKVLPIQLFEIIFLAALFFWLKRLEKNYRLFTWYQDKRGEAQPGFLILTYSLAYAFFRFWLAFLQEADLYWLSLSLPQYLSIGVIVLSIGSFYYKMGGFDNFSDNLLLTLNKINWFNKNLRPEKEILKKPMPRKKRSFYKINHIKTGKDARN